jgi:serine/threonine-protein kinase
MVDEQRIRCLVEEILESDRTPEEVCSDRDLLAAVRKRLEQIQRLGSQLDDMFGDESTRHGTGAVLSKEIELPAINGYEVESVLGRGGMGVVFKARHLKLNRIVALKMLLAGAYAGPPELARFHREAAAVAALRHPNIVQVYDAGEVGGHPYFTMEYVEGGTLAHRLAAEPVTPRRAAELVAILASAVQFAHQSGFIHRDLKPVNILLTPEGTPKITDFGLVRSIEEGTEVTQTGARLGTPSYMAPEQAVGDVNAVGPPADIYALGAVLYEMLTGRPPLEGQSASETVQKVITEDPRPPSTWNRKVPRDLETICLKCLHKAAARRYASAQDLADDLHRFLDGKPVLARPVGLLERAVKWVRRRPVAALLIGVVAVALGVAAGAGIWLRQQELDRQKAQALRQQQAREVLEAILGRIDTFRQEERWHDAQSTFTLASARRLEANSPDLEERFKQAEADFQVAASFEAVRENVPRRPEGLIDYPQWAADFQGAFEFAGLQIDEDAEAVAARIRTSAIRAQMVAAFEDRAFVAYMLKDGLLTKQLLRIARLADPEPVWRDRFRNADTWKDRKQLRQLAMDVFTSSPAPSPHQVALLGVLLRFNGERNEGTHLLAEACRRQPKNFWVNREMGFALVLEQRWLEAAGFYRVAVAQRPDNAGAQDGLGYALANAGQIDDAIAAYRRAVELAPKGVNHQSRLVNALGDAGYWKDAAAACRGALEIDPANYRTPQGLGVHYLMQERFDDALPLIRKAAAIAPDDAVTRVNLIGAYMGLARYEEAAKECRTLAQMKGALPVYAIMLVRHAPQLAAAGRPTDAIEVLEAAALMWPGDFSVHLELGKLYRFEGRPAAAAKEFAKAIEIFKANPEGWDGLAAARLDLGQFAEAHADMERLIKLVPARLSDRPAQQRRLELCKSLLEVQADLPAILAGKMRPAKVGVQRDLATWCLRHKRRTATAAGFYAAAFSSQLALADDLEAGHRLDAACAAALAGCGVGADAGELGEERRAALRKLALEWLTADYDAWAERHRLDKPGDRRLAATTVGAWLRNPDLAGVRDEEALAKLSSEERRAWQDMWTKVRALAERDPVAKLEKARAHVARREWDKAARCYAEKMELEPTEDSDVWFEYAATNLLAGAKDGYQQACAHMLSRCQSAERMRPYHAARASTLTPGVTLEPARLFAQAHKRSETDPWPPAAQGAIQFRIGMASTALPLFERDFAADGRPNRAVVSWLWLALCHHKLGQPEEARRYLHRADNWLSQQEGRMPINLAGQGPTRHNWLEAHVLRRELETLLSPPLAK